MQSHACTRTSKSQIRRARRAARATCHGEMLGTGYALLSRGKGLGERGGKEGRRSGAAGGVGVASTGGNCTAIVFDAPSQPAPQLYIYRRRRRRRGQPGDPRCFIRLHLIPILRKSPDAVAYFGLTRILSKNRNEVEPGQAAPPARALGVQVRVSARGSGRPPQLVHLLRQLRPLQLELLLPPEIPVIIRAADRHLGRRGARCRRTTTQKAPVF